MALSSFATALRFRGPKLRSARGTRVAEGENMKLNRIVAVMVSALSSAACAVPTAEPETTAQDQAAVFFVGGFAWDLFGRTLNGRSLNGKDLGQVGLAYVSLDDATIARRGGVHDVSLGGSLLRVGGGGNGNDDGEPRTLVGAVLNGVLSDGDDLALRIDDANASTEVGSEDVIRYAVSYRADTSWRPLCGLDAHGQPVRAIALAGRWNYRAGVVGGGSHIDDAHAFTFACEGYALAKCVEIGYAPWRTLRAQGGHGSSARVSVAPLHQACTRAIRADYCGDGTSFTTDGVTIDLYDGPGYRTAEPNWPFEAEWDEGGARCAVTRRVPTLPKPGCGARLQTTTCGAATDFRSGALLMSQTSQ